MSPPETLALEPAPSSATPLENVLSLELMESEVARANGGAETWAEKDVAGQAQVKNGQLQMLVSPSIMTKNEPSVNLVERMIDKSAARQVDSLALSMSPSSGNQFFAGQELSFYMKVDGTRTAGGEVVLDAYMPYYLDPSTLAGEQYETLPENAFLPVRGAQALSTFSIDVDTASYANIRRFINQGQSVPPQAVRIEEMINYFHYDYPQPEGEEPFSVNLEVAACPWTPAHKLLRVGIKGKEVHRQERPASNLVFLLDVSGSMSDQNKLPLLQRGMNMLVDRLGENDRVSIVTYASGAQVVLRPTNGTQKLTIRNAIDSLSANGSTNGSAGIQLAYELARESFIEGGTNRVLLGTDGDLNVGVTSDDQLISLIKDKAKSGVFLSVLGFGTGNIKDAKLEKIADNGNRNYSYIDSAREARKVLVEEMSGSLVTIAKDVKLQLEFNPAEVQAYRLIGYENRALSNQDFANDQVDAGEIGAGHTVTALYELVPAGTTQLTGQSAPNLRYQKPADQPVTAATDTQELTQAADSGELLTLSLRYKRPEADESQLMTVSLEDGEPVVCSGVGGFPVCQ